jgi:hypothetical protein
MTIPTARAAGGPAADGSGKITREAVLAAALQIIDRDGAEALCPARTGPSATRAQQSTKSTAAGSIISAPRLPPPQATGLLPPATGSDATWGSQLDQVWW